MRSKYRFPLFLFCVIFISSCGIDVTGKPPFEDLTISPDYKKISMPDGRTWEVIYELPIKSTFSGTVRHKSLWYDASMPFMSHDILVTSGDFASPELVDVSVMGHEFFYHWDDVPPKGSIHLLHIFPATGEIFDQLKQIDKWNEVSISGWEILKINQYDADGQFHGFWMDAGCNTILVTSVTINAVVAPTP